MFFLTIVVLTTLVQCGLSCSCIIPHPQNEYCRREIVIRGTVREIETVNNGSAMMWGGKNIFHVEVTEVFKKPNGSDISAGSVLRLSSSRSDSMCGINLQLKEDLLIAGNGRSVGICNWKVPYSTSDVALFQVYDCKCLVQPMRSGEDAGSCFGHGEACVKGNNTGCNWFKKEEELMTRDRSVSSIS